MAIGTRIFNAIARFNNGLLVPTNAGVGKVLSSDAEGKGTWQLPGEASVAMAYRSAAQNLPSATPTKIKLDKVIKDPGGNIGANDFYTAPSTGYYHIDGQVACGTLAAKATLEAWIQVNGGLALSGLRVFDTAELGGFVYATVAGIVELKAGDKVELYAQQSGVECALQVAGSFENRLSVMRVGEGPVGPTGPEGTVKVGTPAAVETREAGKSYEPSATETTTVYLSITLKAEKSKWEVLVEGKPIYTDAAETLVAADLDQTYMFRIAAKGKWELKMVEGTAATVKSVYQAG